MPNVDFHDVWLVFFTRQANALLRSLVEQTRLADFTLGSTSRYGPQLSSFKSILLTDCIATLVTETLARHSRAERLHAPSSSLVLSQLGHV